MSEEDYKMHIGQYCRAGVQHRYIPEEIYYHQGYLEFVKDNCLYLNDNRDTRRVQIKDIITFETV